MNDIHISTYEYHVQIQPAVCVATRIGDLFLNFSLDSSLMIQASVSGLFYIIVRCQNVVQVALPPANLQALSGKDCNFIAAGRM